MEIFNFRDGHVTTFRHPSGAYICQMPGPMQTLQTSKRHTFRVLAFHRCHWFGVKLFSVGCAQDSRSKSKTQKKIMFWDLAPPTLQNSGIFHDSIRPHLHIDGLPPKSRRSVVSIKDLGCVTSITNKMVWYGIVEFNVPLDTA